MIETNIKRTAKASAKHRPHFGFTQCFDDPACFHEPAIGLVPGRATMNFKYGIEELINILDRWPCQIAAGLGFICGPNTPRSMSTYQIKYVLGKVASTLQALGP